MSKSPIYATAGSLIGSQAKVRHRSIYGSNYAEAIPTERNKKMKLTFKQKLRNWLMNDYSNESPEVVPDSGPNFDADPLRIHIYKASGGFVVETRKYDRRKDENNVSMNIITDDKDLGEELGRIITMETLR